MGLYPGGGAYNRGGGGGGAYNREVFLFQIWGGLYPVGGGAYNRGGGAYKRDSTVCVYDC